MAESSDEYEKEEGGNYHRPWADDEFLRLSNKEVKALKKKHCKKGCSRP